MRTQGGTETRTSDLVSFFGMLINPYCFPSTILADFSINAVSDVFSGKVRQPAADAAVLLTYPFRHKDQHAETPHDLRRTFGRVLPGSACSIVEDKDSGGVE